MSSKRYPGLHKSKGTTINWHRIAVPVDGRSQIGKTELWDCLGTREFSEAEPRYRR
jgi:hypothetical protein